MKIWPCIFVVCAMFFLACERETQIPVYVSEPTIDDLIMENCLIVQAAAEAFADQNDGDYPFKLRSYTPPVYSLIDFLPDSTLLTNPVTGEATEPHRWPYDCDPAGKGAVCYRGYGQWDPDQSVMRCVGYYIRGLGLGRDGDMVITNVPDSTIAFVDSLETLVKENCEAVVIAAANFAFENGAVPPTTLEEVSPRGNTLIDYLPGGHRLENPFTNELTEPAAVSTRTPGQTTYNPVINAAGSIIGFEVRAFGCCFQIEYIAFYPGGCVPPHLY